MSAVHGITAAPVSASAIANTAGEGQLLNVQKDAKESQTEAKFGDTLKSIQNQFGAPQAKPRQVKKQMDKDDFLKIMVTQMKNQDPTNPMKADQFATQLAQFTSVEQLQNLNQQMKKMTTANQPLERLALTSMIGKVVTVDRDRFMHTENETSPLAFELPENAKDVSITVINEAGEKVYSKDLGPMRAGKQTFQWDGKKETGEEQKSGNYLFRISARRDQGGMIEMKSVSQQPVVGVTFEGGEGMLLVGDVRNPTKTNMKAVLRVDTALRPELEKPAAKAGPDLQVQELLKNSGGLGAMNGMNAPGENSPAANSAAVENIYTKNNENNSDGGFPNGISSGDNEN